MGQPVNQPSVDEIMAEVGFSEDGLTGVDAQAAQDIMKVTPKLSSQAAAVVDKEITESGVSFNQAKLSRDEQTFLPVVPNKVVSALDGKIENDYDRENASNLVGRGEELYLVYNDTDLYHVLDWSLDLLPIDLHEEATQFAIKNNIEISEDKNIPIRVPFRVRNAQGRLIDYLERFVLKKRIPTQVDSEAMVGSGIKSCLVFEPKGLLIVTARQKAALGNLEKKKLQLGVNKDGTPKLSSYLGFLLMNPLNAEHLKSSKLKRSIINTQDLMRSGVGDFNIEEQRAAQKVNIHVIVETIPSNVL